VSGCSSSSDFDRCYEVPVSRSLMPPIVRGGGSHRMKRSVLIAANIRRFAELLPPRRRLGSPKAALADPSGSRRRRAPRGDLPRHVVSWRSATHRDATSKEGPASTTYNLWLGRVFHAAVLHRAFLSAGRADGHLMLLARRRSYHDLEAASSARLCGPLP